MAGGTMLFMAPELLVPSLDMLDKGEPSKGNALPTPQADIYAFGMVIFQVCERGRGYRLVHVYFPQVLTGKTPFRNIPGPAITYHVYRGRRPFKPENASAIGFSDSVWGLTQQCWDGEKGSRPKVGEVVTLLGEAAAKWDVLMPPCVSAENDTSSFGEGSSDSGEFGEFEI